MLSYETLKSAHDRLSEMVGDIDPASPRGKTRKRLLDAAADLFVTQGYRKTGIDEIARKAGIGKGSVYLHFATKADLLVAAAAREKLRSLALAAEVYSGATPQDRLRGWVRASLLMVAASPLIARLVDGDEEFASVLADLDPAVRSEAISNRDEFLGRLLDDAVGPPALTAAERHERMVVLAAMAHLAPRVRHTDVRQDLSVERFVDVFSKIVADGLVTRHSPNGAK